MVNKKILTIAALTTVLALSGPVLADNYGGTTANEAGHAIQAAPAGAKKAVKRGNLKAKQSQSGQKFQRPDNWENFSPAERKAYLKKVKAKRAEKRERVQENRKLHKEKVQERRKNRKETQIEKRELRQEDRVKKREATKSRRDGVKAKVKGKRQIRQAVPTTE